MPRAAKPDFDEPAVSVIIPTCNRAAYLEAAVRSVLAQTHRPAEVIIVDDGSTDGTAELCMSFPEPVQYIRQENAGVSAARNRGIRNAKGEYVALLDSDDVWHATKLETQLAALREFPEAQWCTCACNVIDDHGAPLRPGDGLRQVFPVFDSLGLSPEELFQSRLERFTVQAAAAAHTVFVGDAFELLFHGNFVLPSAAVLHRRVIDRVGLFDEAFRKAEETEFFHRVAARFPTAMVMSPLVDYRMGQADALTSPSNTAALERWRAGGAPWHCVPIRQRPNARRSSKGSTDCCSGWPMRTFLHWTAMLPGAPLCGRGREERLSHPVPWACMPPACSRSRSCARCTRRRG